MVDYTRAIKRPFEDVGTLAIGIILSLVPIVSFLAMGYQVNIAKETLNGKYGMPKWDDWGGLFVKGLIVAVMYFVYLIPAMIVFVLGAGGVVAAAISNPSAVMGAIAGGGVFILLGGLLALLAMYLIPAGIVGYARSDDIKAFFDRETIFSKAFKADYFIVSLVMMVLWIVAMVVSGIIPVIGFAVGSFSVGVMGNTLFAEVCK